MEKRLFKFGKNSVAIVIPKKWVQQKMLKHGALIYLNENESGELIVSSAQTPKKEAEEDVTNLSPNIVSRLIGFHHLYGTTKLNLYSKSGFTQKDAERIHERINKRYIGFEIVKQNKNELLIEDMSSVKETSMERIFSRMHNLISEEFSLVLSGDTQALQTSEDVVDRFYLFGVRYLNLVKPADLYAYFRLLQMAELISDWLTLVSKNRSKQVDALVAEAKKQFELSINALKGDEKTILDAIVLGDLLLKKVKSQKLTDFQRMLLDDLVWSIVAIAETGIVWRKKKNEFLL
ncbi:MAG: hypothetical protein ACREBF_04560 [Candidatus Micrarchaeales archaeon]